MSATRCGRSCTRRSWNCWERETSRRGRLRRGRPPEEGSAVSTQELPRAEAGNSREKIEYGEKSVAGNKAGALRDPTERETHKQLNRGAENGDRGLRAAHEVFGDDGHQAGLGDDTTDGAASPKGHLQGDGTGQEGYERNEQVAGGESGKTGGVQREAQGPGELAGEKAAEDGAGGPSGFEKTEAARAGMQDVIGESNENDIGADDAGHHDGMGDAEGADGGLLPEVSEAFFQIRVDGEAEAGFGDFRIFGGFEGFGGGFGAFGKGARIFLMLAGRDIAAAQMKKTISRDEVGESIDAENAGDAGAVVKEADSGTREEHAGLDADQDGGVGAGELALGDDLLNESVDGGPVHGGTGAGNEGHGVEMPELEMAAPGDIGSGEHGDAAGEIEQNAQVAAVVAVNKHASEKGHEEAGQSYDNDLEADGERGMRRGENVPADAGKIHSAAEQRNEHGDEEVTEAALGPDDRPVRTHRRRSRHGRN